MRRWLTAWIAIAVLAVLAGLTPASALAANAYSQVSTAINHSSTSSVKLCEFSNAELQAALNEAPVTADEYQSSFASAVHTAIDAQAQGACSQSKTSTTGATQRATSLTGGGGLPGSVSSHTASGLPLLLVVILGLAGLGVIIAGFAGVYFLLGWDPRAGRAAVHSLREAEYRLGAQWEDFVDRLSPRRPSRRR